MASQPSAGFEIPSAKQSVDRQKNGTSAHHRRQDCAKQVQMLRQSLIFQQSVLLGGKRMLIFYEGFRIEILPAKFWDDYTNQIALADVPDFCFWDYCQDVGSVADCIRKGLKGCHRILEDYGVTNDFLSPVWPPISSSVQHDDEDDSIPF